MNANTAAFARSGRLPEAPAKLNKRLKGDLDNIILKALRKEQRLRYSSVEQLAEDIRRHLNGLPVTAVKGSLRYRVGKFARRNRAGIVAATAITITLLAGIVATIRQARIARRQAEIASAERARAEKRFADVRELANSLIFEIHDSIQSLPGATPSRKLLLDRAVQYLDKLSQDAAGDVNLQRELAWAYQRLATVQGDTTQSNLGQVKAAEVSNRKAMALFEAVAKANPHNLTDQLNLAMTYRWRAFLDIYEPNGIAEINRALAVTEPLLRSLGDDLNLKNELAQEYYIQALVQDAIGNRLQSIESFRRGLDLRQQIQRANSSYPDIRRGIAKVTVLLAHEIGRFGSRDEGLRLMNTGISDFEALAKETGGDPGIVREVSAAKTRRADIQLMRADITSARVDFQSARQLIDRLAKLDPENKMLQSDIWVAEFEDGRALALAGRYAEALPVINRAFLGYKSLHLEEDVGPGSQAMQAWIAEAEAGTRNFASALKNYQAAAHGLEEDETHFDDARCDLAMVETKIGAVLFKMGRARQAAAHYQRALEKAKLQVSLENNDLPGVYAAAEAYSGEGDIAAAQARATADKAVQQKLWNDACRSYETSLGTWRRIPNPSRFTSNGYMVGRPQDTEHRLQECRAELAMNQ
jgi:tetratricopeptide (TPR) repeat protein